MARSKQHQLSQLYCFINFSMLISLLRKEEKKVQSGHLKTSSLPWTGCLQATSAAGSPAPQQCKTSGLRILAQVLGSGFCGSQGLGVSGLGGSYGGIQGLYVAL